MLAIAVLCAVALFAAIFLHDMRIQAMATALLVLSSIVVSGAWPLLMEQFSVRPNPADVERPYIERNIDGTRQAYRIGDDWVDYRDYPGVGTKAPRDVSAEMTAIANAGLLDPNVLSRTFTQQQQLKNFSGFHENLDIDRYRIDGSFVTTSLPPANCLPTVSPGIRWIGSTGTPSTPTATASSPLRPTG